MIGNKNTFTYNDFTSSRVWYTGNQTRQKEESETVTGGKKWVKT